MKSISQIFLNTLLFNSGKKLPLIKHDENYLGAGFSLVKIDFENNRFGYCHLHKDGVKVSNDIFRLGGLATTFKQNPRYCSLLWYPDVKTELGHSCVINTTGKIVVKVDRFKHIYLHKGIIATVDKDYYNLVTGKVICRSGSGISCEQYVFVKVFDFRDESKSGVYRIEYETGAVEIYK